MVCRLAPLMRTRLFAPKLKSRAIVVVYILIDSFGSEQSICSYLVFMDTLHLVAIVAMLNLRACDLVK